MYSIYFKPFPTFETERLILRKVKRSDAKDLYEYCRSPISAKFAEWYPHEDIGITKQYISWLLSGVRQGRYMTWCIELKSSGKVIGTCGFTAIDREYKVAEIGYGIINEYWGEGYAREALEAIFEYGFCNIGLCRIFARIMKGNNPSIHLALRLGMECEGYMKKAVWCKDKANDIYLYAITDDAYREIIAQSEKAENKLKDEENEFSK